MQLSDLLENKIIIAVVSSILSSVGVGVATNSNTKTEMTDSCTQAISTIVKAYEAKCEQEKGDTKR